MTKVAHKLPTVGEECYTQLEGSSKYFPAKVLSIEEDGKFDLLFDDGTTNTIAPKYIRVCSAVIRYIFSLRENLCRIINSRLVRSVIRSQDCLAPLSYDIKVYETNRVP